MDKMQEQPKKCFCARCFLPIEADDKVDIEGQNFHRMCSMCCICRTIPPSLKMFYGHVFCNDCFKTHVLTRFRGENPRIHSNSWWMQWAPGTKPVDQDFNSKDNKDVTNEEMKSQEACNEDVPKRCICARCLLPVDENNKLYVGGQNFHVNCAKCYFCHEIPTNNLKIYYGQVFCEECFHQHVLNQNRDNASEFFKNCFEQWQGNAQFAENMREFMTGNKEASPFVFMMPGQQSPFCRCGTGPQEWFQNNEPKKSATPATISNEGESLGTWDLSFENRTEVSDFLESCNAVDESANLENLIVTAAAEKIEKLTKYLHERDIEVKVENTKKKWKNFIEYDKMSMVSDEPLYHTWVDLQDHKIQRSHVECPACLWHCGPIYVNREYILSKQICCGEELH